MASLRAGRQQRRFAEFALDAESLAERGHSPLAGLLILAIALVFASLLGWSALAEVEQVVRAEGQVEPAGRVKVINHPDGGRVVEIHVVEGQKVEAGDPLLTFDAELMLTELAALRGRYQVKAAETARLAAEGAGGAPVFPPDLAAARPDLIAEQTRLMEGRRDAQASRVAALQQAVERRAGEARTLAADLARLKDSHDLLGQQVESVRELAEMGLYPRMRLVAIERQLVDLGGEIRKARERLPAAKAALAEAESRRDAAERDWRSRVLAELARTTAERDRLAEALKRQQAMLRNLAVRAPVAGIVQDLQVTSVGQSVGSNQPLMKIVPVGGTLLIEARVDNQDIGHVRVGQTARVKVRAYDFLRFGTLDGRIEQIAADATPDPRSGALGYKVTVHTEASQLDGLGAGIVVVPGMVVDVDLLVGERTILSYLTDRLFRLREDAFRLG